MPRVELSATAAEDLARLRVTHSLPPDTIDRFKRSIRGLGRFPRLGAPLAGAWGGLRFVLGPWRWMVVVYEYLEEEDLVVVVTVQDARSSSAATGER